MTIAEMKRRLVPGAQVRQTTQGGANCDRLFTVTQTQHNGVYGVYGIVPGREGRVWLPIPKREEIVFTDKGWTRRDEGREIARYEWVNSQEVSA